jgi:hypothetical protein
MSTWTRSYPRSRTGIGWDSSRAIEARRSRRSPRSACSARSTRWLTALAGVVLAEMDYRGLDVLDD